MKRISTESIFKRIPKFNFVFLTIYSLIIYLAYNLNFNVSTTYMFSTVIIITSLVNPTLSFAMYIISIEIISQKLTAIQIISLLFVLLIQLILKNKQKKFNLKEIVILLLSGLSIILSGLAGIDINLSSAILLYISIVSFVVINKYYNLNDISTIVYSYILAALCIDCAVLTDYLIKGKNILMYGRLNFNGDIKGLAIINAFPLALLIFSKMENKNIFWKNNTILFLIITILMAVTITLTAARGVILALVICIIIEYLLLKNKKRATIYFIIIVTIVAIGYNFLYDSNIFRVSRITNFEEYESGNGRTEIWADYTKKVFSNGPLIMLFGFGPGNIARISETGYYSHSTFLDYLFSYGVVGFTLMICLEIYILNKGFKKKKAYIISLLLLLIFMNATHGSAANPTMYIMQAIALNLQEVKGELNE